jgi:hypothetical protein
VSATAFGLTFDLPFPCPGLVSATASATPDVTVVEGRVPRELGVTAIRGDGFDAEQGRFLLRGGRHSARFLIEDGTRVTIDRNPKCEDAIVAFQFTHSVMAALLHQRGCLVLHASAVLLDDGVAIVTGESGAGKSTTLAALAARGYRALSDDVTALAIGSDGEIEVTAGLPWIHLCGDAAAMLAPEHNDLPREEWHRMKVAVPVAGCAGADRMLLRRWVTLAVGPGGELRTRYLSGTEKMAALLDGIFVPMSAGEHAQRHGLLRVLMERIGVLSIERPAGEWMVDRLVEAVLRG